MRKKKEEVAETDERVPLYGKEFNYRPMAVGDQVFYGDNKHFKIKSVNLGETVTLTIVNEQSGHVIEDVDPKEVYPVDMMKWIECDLHTELEMIVDEVWRHKEHFLDDWRYKDIRDEIKKTEKDVQKLLKRAWEVGAKS